MILLIIGCGSIGTVIARFADKMPEVDDILLFDHDMKKATDLAKSLKKAKSLATLDFKTCEADIAIEAASQKAAKDFIPLALENSMDAMVMSVGAFGDKSFQDRCYSDVAAYDSLLLIPSGAVSGVDALKGASKANIESVRLESTKPPKGFLGVKYLEDKGVDVMTLKERTVLYSGPASEAVQYFPANVNVAATVSLSGIGFERTQVEIVCDPAATLNSHRLIAKGDFGELEATTSNRPSPDNPRTSYLAALSAVSTLSEYVRRVWVGV
jgi:aspartate dehydrogenase